MLSVVVPVFNEAPSLRTLHAELSEVAAAQHYDLEIIFIDDGSTDESWEHIVQLAAADPRVRGIRFRRNFGKAAALSAGFAAARGQYVMTLDADLQDDPREIPNFLRCIESTDQGGPLDVVSGWKRRRHDPWHKVWPSRVFNWLVSRVTGVRLHDHNCGMKCYRQEVLREIRLYGELHRFVPVLAAARGFRVGEIAIQHRPRRYGRSKYGFERFTRGLLDLMTVQFLTGYGQRPQHLLGKMGLLCFLLGLLGLTALGVWWIVSRTVAGLEPIHLHQRAVFFYALGALLLGGQLLSVGLLAEMITEANSRQADAYSIKEETPPHASSQADERTAG